MDTATLRGSVDLLRKKFSNLEIQSKDEVVASKNWFLSIEDLEEIIGEKVVVFSIAGRQY